MVVAVTARAAAARAVATAEAATAGAGKAAEETVEAATVAERVLPRIRCRR